MDAKQNEEHSHEEVIDHAQALPTDQKWWNWRVLMNLTIVGFALGLYGYDNAFTSPLVSLPLFVNKYQGLGFDGLPVFTARNLDLVITVPIVGAALGAFSAIPIQNYLGRKGGFLVAYATMCIPGSILQLFAPNLGALVVGRFWNYFGISILTNIAPIYLSELVPANVRARAVGFAIAGSGAVSVIATVVVWGSAKILDHRQYIIPLAIQAALPVLLLALSFLLTESPIWLLGKGRTDEAKASLTVLRGGNSFLAEAELSIATVALRSTSEKKTAFKFWEILNLANLERTMSSAALLCLSQVGGQILVGTYSTVILVQSGVSDPFKITIIIFLMQFVGTLLGPFLLDRFGRRTVALPGYVLLFLLDLAAGIIACVGLKTRPEQLALAALCIIFAFVNSISFQSIIYVLPTEIPTAHLREPSMTWTLFWSYVTAIITTFAIPQLTSADAGNLGAKAFLVFGGFMLITIVWSYFYLPETAKRTLAEIDELYERKVPKRHWASYKIEMTESEAKSASQNAGVTD
ncbi:MFS domain-containing protein [Trichoderma simmonsii]|uniref:MFS domain-containing protein n=1 Tax=Trichoderma simmonsii TaxID=1491479 RepID=A0A8G0PBS1_9HYPO|nr:MFS domain-containing protein [Trichoderma simmonsii]